MHAELPEHSPGPAGSPLSLLIECRTGDPTKRGKKHPITIHPDWSVSTGHDLEAERIAVSMGGYTSCIDLVDRSVPAFRAGLGYLTRRTPVRLTINGDNAPLAAKRGTCCLNRRFKDLASAAEHVRRVDHIAQAHGAPEWQLRGIVAAAEATWGPFDMPPPIDRGIERLVREPGGVSHLWRAGIHPDDIPSLASLASVVDEPLPTSYFIGMTQSPVDPAWFASVLAHRPDADTASWLASLEAQERQYPADQWGVWLSLGLSRQNVLTVLNAKIPPPYAHEISLLMGWTPHEAALHLATWARAGCIPKAHHFQTMRRAGIDHAVPSRMAIDALCADAESVLGMDIAPYAWTDNRTDLAVMLAALGTRPDVLVALQRGIRSMEQLLTDTDSET